MIYDCAILSDIDEFCESVPQWDIDFMQIEKGPLAAKLYTTGYEGLTYAGASFNRGLQQNGSAPKGSRTFAVMGCDGQAMWWRKKQVQSHNIMVFPKNGELECFSPSGLELYTISFAESQLLSLCRESGVRGLYDKITGSELFTLPLKDMVILKGTLANVSKSIAEGKKAEALKKISALPQSIVTLFAHNACPEKKRRYQKSASILKEAIAFLRASSVDKVNIDDLCKAVNLKRRTLFNLFKQQLGVSPKQYLKCYRLHRVRQDLKRHPVRTVHQCAEHWGFWHMGDFSHDYKTMFGELPSETRKTFRMRLLHHKGQQLA